MSENIIPDVIEKASDVLETVTTEVEQKVETAVNYAEMTFKELLDSFNDILGDEQKMKRQKDIEF